MSRFNDAQKDLVSRPRTWLVTGAAGFIGSHLVENLLRLGQRVIGLDNFSTGTQANLDDALKSVNPEAASRFRFIKGDVRSLDTCRAVCTEVDFVLHQAALGSVPRSLMDPLTSHLVNVDGTLNMLLAARDAGVKRFVYASSSSVYGDHPDLPKCEIRIGSPLSPYAATKRISEIYAGVIAKSYGLESVGLRYFNVFGKRQDPNGPYAAVIPKWASALLRLESCTIHGDGMTSRDFCFVSNVVQANILAATVPSGAAVNQVYNVAYGQATSLNELFESLRVRLSTYDSKIGHAAPRYSDFRTGDVRHSLADITQARELLGYEPTHSLADGLDATLNWFVDQMPSRSATVASVTDAA